MPTDQFKPKSFWARPEGTTGMVAIGLVVVGLALSAQAILAFITTMVSIFSAAIVMTVLGVILAALLYVITNKRFRTLTSYMFKGAMRKFTGWFVEIDPIGIMRSYIEELKAKRETMSGSIAKLRGQITACETQIKVNNKEYDTEMLKFKIAKDKKLESAATVASRQAGRLEKLNQESLIPINNQMTAHLRALNKYYEVTGTVIDDLGNEVKAQEMQRKMMAESYSAMSTAKKILNGGTDQKEIFDQAMEYVVQDYGMKMGEIENFIENSKGFVESLDIQNGVYEAEALQKLQAWEAKADSILLGTSGKQQIVEQQQYSPLTSGIGAPAASQVDYSDLISRK